MNIEQMIKDKKIYIISPHLDDAVLSCGSLLLNLKDKEDITIINVFTKAHEGPYTLSAHRFIKDSGSYSDATDLFEERAKEDKHALADLNVKIINLGLEEALFRRKKQSNILGKVIPEFDHIYPTYRWHITKSISPNDPVLVELKNALKEAVKEDAVVFVPYGIGKHVDHQITCRICGNLFDNVIYYSDFPYNIRENNYGKEYTGYYKMVYGVDLEKKSAILKKYKTQFQGIFPSLQVPDHNEYYFIKKYEKL